MNGINQLISGFNMINQVLARDGSISMLPFEWMSISYTPAILIMVVNT